MNQEFQRSFLFILSHAVKNSSARTLFLSQHISNKANEAPVGRLFELAYRAE